MLDSQEIIKVLDILIGQTEAVGDTAIDEHREARLKVLIDVTNWCLDGVQCAAVNVASTQFKWRNRQN